MELPALTSTSRLLQMGIAHESDKKTKNGLLSKIKKIFNSSLEMDTERRLLNHNGISISQTGHAKQLVIMTHGGWKEIERNATVFHRQSGDGWTSVLHGTRLDFYTRDCDFTKGTSVFSEINERPRDALNGLKASADLSDSALTLLAGSRNMTVTHLKNEMAKLATCRKEYINGGDVVKNYALYRHGQTDSLIKKHQSGSYNKEIDIAVVTDKKHKKHLSDVFGAIEKAGAKYKVIHFGACRVDRGNRAVPGLSNPDSEK